MKLSIIIAKVEDRLRAATADAPKGYAPSHDLVARLVKDSFKEAGMTLSTKDAMFFADMIEEANDTIQPRKPTI